MTALDEIYDPATVRAIDGWSVGGSAEPVGGARGSALAGAILVAGLVGGRSALEEIEPEIMLVRPDSGTDTAGAVIVYFVPDDAEATVAVVRPWRLRSSLGLRLVFRADTGIPGGVTPPP